MVGAAVGARHCLLFCLLLWVSGSSCLDDITCGELLKCSARTQYCAWDTTMCSDCSGVCPGALCRTYCPHYRTSPDVSPAESQHRPVRNGAKITGIVVSVAVIAVGSIVALSLYHRWHKNRNEVPGTAGGVDDEAAVGLVHQEGSRASQLTIRTPEVPVAVDTTDSPVPSYNPINNALSDQALDDSRVPQPGEVTPPASSPAITRGVGHPSSSQSSSSSSQLGESSTRRGNPQPGGVTRELSLSLSLSSEPHIEGQPAVQEEGSVGLLVGTTREDSGQLGGSR